jgi:heptosyltransferase III
VEGAVVPQLDEFDSIYSWYGANRPEFRDAVRDLPFDFFPALPPPAMGIPRIAVPPAHREDFAVIHPFASSAAKRWPLENFRSVAAELGMPVRWCAGPAEPLEGAVRFRDLYELACWISTARVYIGNDSGISHLAAAVGTPVVAIFLCTDPCIWSPRGERVKVRVNPSVEEVVAAALHA